MTMEMTQISFNLDELTRETVLLVEEGVWSMTEHLWLLVCGIP
jgi:hypothetical protein